MLSNTNILMLFVLLLLPDKIRAKPLSNQLSTDQLSASLSLALRKNTADTGARVHTVKPTEKSTSNSLFINNILDNTPINTEDSQKHRKARNRRWNANLLALALYDRSRREKNNGLNAKSVAQYDPFSTGPWGRKKRSVPEYSDFDYEEDDL